MGYVGYVRELEQQKGVSSTLNNSGAGPAPGHTQLEAAEHLHATQASPLPCCQWVLTIMLLTITGEYLEVVNLLWAQ